MEKFRKIGFLDRETRSQVTRVSPDHQKELRKNHCFYLSPYSFQPHKNMLSKKADLNSGSVVKNPPANAGNTGNMGSVPGLGRSPAGGNGNPFQYSCLENPMDRGAWQATVHGVAKSQTRLSMHTQNVI